MDSWPKDTNHNVIRRIVSDMNILNHPRNQIQRPLCRLLQKYLEVLLQKVALHGVTSVTQSESEQRKGK